MQTTSRQTSEHPSGTPAPADPYALFVGRQAELETMVRALDDAAAGRGRLVLLAGEPGIGKTRLCDELASHATATGWTVVWGRAWEAGGAPAFWPWIQSLRELVRSLEDDSLRAHLAGRAAEIAQLLPELNERLGALADLPPASAESARFRLFDAVAEFLRSASREMPVAMVLEDLHGLDSSSILLLRFVAEGLGGSRVLLIGTYRDVEVRAEEPLAAALPDLLRVRGALRLTLSGLSAEDVAALVRGVSRATPSEALTRAIDEATEGNPLFVRELVQLLASEGRLSEGTDRRRLGVPEGVREVIDRRLERLSEGSKRTLTVASVLGREFTLDALERVLDRPSAELLEALGEAQQQRIVAEATEAPGRLRFSHSLIRETLYETLGPTERAQLHRSVAEALQALYGRDEDPYLAELAHHFSEAGPSEVARAAEYAGRAGERALTLLAYEEAVRLFRLALRSLERSRNEEARCGLLVSLGDAQARSGDVAGSRDTFLRAAELAKRLGLPEHLGRAALGYGGRLAWIRGSMDAHIVPLLTDALEALPATDGEVRARLMALLACALRDEPDPTQRLGLSAEAVAMARRLGDPATLAYTLDGRWAATLAPHNADEALAIADELHRVVEATGDKEGLAVAHYYRIWPLFRLGDMAGARRAFEAGRRIAEELRQPVLAWELAAQSASIALFEGRFDEAEALIAEMERAGARTGHWGAPGAQITQTFALRREQARLREIRDPIRDAADRYATRPLFRCILANLHAGIDDRAGAARVFETLAKDGFTAVPRDNEWLLGMSLLVEVADFLGDAERAPILYELLDPFRDLDTIDPGEFSAGAVARYVGVAASLSSRWDDAERHLNRALESNERAGARPWAAYTRHDLARMLLRRGVPGDRATAAELLGEVAAACQEMGMTALGRRAAAALEAMGAERAGAPAQPPAAAEPAAGVHIFRREGEYFTITFEGRSLRLRDVKGLRYLARLLAAPGREIHVLDLLAEGGAPAQRSSEPSVEVASSDAGPAIDAEARDAYRARIRELQEDIDEAEAWGDPERAARATEEMQFIARELAGAVGLGGRPRTVGSAAERGRQSVTKAIRAAIDKIGEHHPGLGSHLERTVRTGTFCSYAPDPRSPTRWEA